ncbi:hypothetical protein [Luteitalea sp.]|uniref:hypothetical protein n=1 Tax=Luteitalea sp. TaxID=2004800 RepID=UPI0025C70B04|nr:hypothetical protein [Luteitalea sp.]
MTAVGSSADTREMGLGLRPHVEVLVSASSRDTFEQVCGHFEKTPNVVRRTRVPGGGTETAPRNEDHLVVTVPTTAQHFWSPWLTIEVTPRGHQAHVLARFSPHPSVWTGFAFCYLTLGLVGAVALTVGAAGALLPDSSQTWAFWVAAGAVAAMGGLWLFAQVGQRLASEQMALLRAELERALAASR